MKKANEANLRKVKVFMEEVKEISEHMNMSIQDYIEYFMDDVSKVEFSNYNINSSTSVIQLVGNQNKSNKEHQLIHYIAQKDENIKKLNRAIIAIQTLPEVLNKVAYLYFFEFKTYDEISDILMIENYGCYDSPRISRMMKDIYKRLLIILKVVLSDEEKSS